MSTGQEGLRKIRLLPPSKENPGNSEGSIIELKDGRLFLAYSHFYGGGDDNSSAYIAGRFSEDKGMTWENHKIIEDDPDGWYCYTSCTFVNNTAVLSYCAGNSKIGGLNLLQITLMAYQAGGFLPPKTGKNLTATDRIKSRD